MTPALIPALAALLLGQATPTTVPPEGAEAARAETARRLSPEDEEVIRNLELLERLELLEKLELFDAAGDDAAADAKPDDASGAER
jgi:hypothetical protein